MRALIVLLACALPLAGCTDEHEQLMKELGHRSPVRRAGAVKSLARLGDDESYMLISSSLQDRSAIVRIAVVQALCEFKGRDTTAAIARATRDRDPEVRETAVNALGRGTDEQAKQALVKMLLRGEPNTKVRKLAYAILARKGLSAERLTGEMAESQMAMAREQMAKGTSADRLRAVRMAGRTVHPGGLDLVIEGLADRDQDVVLGALAVIDGRGGTAALRRMQLLLSDQVDDIRLATVRALAAFGPEGLKLLQAAMRDPEAAVRLATIEEYERHGKISGTAVACRLLDDPDARVAIRTAALLRGKQSGCDLAPLRDALAGPDPAAVRRAVGVLSTLGGEAAIRMLQGRLDRAGDPDRLPLLAALARAGRVSSDTRRRLQLEFDRALDEIDRLCEGWVTGKLMPGEADRSGGKAPADSDHPDDDANRLSDEELSRLYKKYGLGPADEDSPRGIQDILARFEDPESAGDDSKLFDPISAELVDRISMALDGLLQVDPEKAGGAVGRALGMRKPAMIARVARVLLAHEVSVELNDDMLRNVGEALRVADVPETLALAGWLIHSTGKDARLVPLLTGTLQASDWEKRLPLIEALGRRGDPSAVGVLSGLLEGYSAIPAARALALIGDESAIEPLMSALGRAGPAEEMEILLALARLGSGEPLPRLLQRLDDSDPDVRRSAVRILGVMGQGLDAVSRLRYDLDRLVRKEVSRILEEGNTGDGSDVRPKEED